MKTEQESLDSIFSDMNQMIEPCEQVKTKCVTFWIPEEYKLKYDQLQKRTKRQFSKKVIMLLMKSLDKVAV